jgi:hypothetical protein
VHEPSSSVTLGDAGLNIVYSASDPDVGDAVEVELYANSASAGGGGIRFARGLPSGQNAVGLLTKGAVPPGTYRVMAKARDAYGAEVWAEAGGTVTVDGSTGGSATLEITDPDGVNDIDEDGVVSIGWKANVPLGTSATLSLFLDDDEQDEGGEPLAGAIPVGGESPVTFRWDTSETEAGTYFVYGVLEAEGNRVVSYAAEAVTVGGAGCGCDTLSNINSSQSLPAAGVVAILAAVLKPRRKASARRPR